MSHILKLFYRVDCSLCEEMHRELSQLSAQADFAIEAVDVDSSAELRSRYGHKVPVLTDQAGYEICHYFLDHQALHAYFATH